ncbi:MAG: MFS transporter [Flavobacteriaceae bacterium]|jgi:maltose/moltooligosaccharide transporter|nr:MFS transporter [Flavobacteriaceae bacterium]MDO7582024.1 MFS transporter [Flavobacteriaceae bacterium]MDO7590894.1 MFS transporter [Flavobacteriaceae bacterium]MDO7599407.1 MFS transporter [Flavobacteriaceae bacterium]MDO7603616.1 MFS transporter [Flavobacteriaceae bacterium]
MMQKQQLSFWQILTMNFGFFGVQFSFGLQQSNMSAIYKYLGANESELPMLWLAGPVTGLLVQPIIGAISDGTWSPKFGRRKPFFLIGALLASLALVVMPYSSSIWMAASLLWILDAANNIALEPYRAFVSDKLPKKQYSIGFLMQSFFTGLGSVMSNFTPAILVSFGILALSDKMDNGIPVSTYWAFAIGAIASIGTILVTVLTTSEYPPTEEELAVIKANKAKGNAFLRSLNDIKASFVKMPKTMRQLIPVMFFSWYAMFCYWQYLTSALSLSLFFTLDECTEFFNQAQLLTGNLNGTYNIICVLIAFPMIPIARKLGAKNLHFLSLLLGGIGLMAMPFLNDSDILFTIPLGSGIAVSQIYLFSFGLGITWASMMAMPYQMLATSIPSDKMGVYMGIFNMFIVIPMIIQIFSMQYFVYDLLGSNPINVIRLAGACLAIAGFFSLFVKEAEEQVA